LIRLRGWADVQGDTRLDVAKRQAASGATREALEGMLAALAQDRDAARQAMVDVFAVLGDDDPLVVEFRRKLTNALY
jgi:putative thioredoxin